MPLKRLSYNATLIRRTDFTPKLAAFHVRYDEPLEGTPPFVPGQYVALGLNNTAQPALGSVRRSMSIASAPEAEESLEFYVRFVEQPESANPLTHLLWSLQPGERLFVTRKPTGKFTLPATCGASSARLEVLVAAGTGLAPFLSMVRSRKLSDPSADMRRVILIHGASYPADLGYRDELSRYAAENGLAYLPTISRPQDAPAWQGDIGRAEDFLLPDRLQALERRIGLAPDELNARNADVLVCGLQGTIARCVERLAARGFVPFHRRIRSALGITDDMPPSLWWEQYDAEPVIDLHDADLLAELKRALDAGRARLDAAPALALSEEA